MGMMDTEANPHLHPNPNQVMGMMNMLGLAKRVKARILQASTSEVNAPRTHRQQHTASRASEPPHPALPSGLRGEEHGAAALSHRPPVHLLLPLPPSLSHRSPGCLPVVLCVPQVYGDPEISPQPEEYWGHVNCTGVRSCYDEGKRAAETLCFDYHRQNGVDIRIARIFNTYGPGMHPYDGRVVSNFIVQAIKGEDITVYGEGQQTRAFCYVDDLVDGLIRLMNQEHTIGPVNIGNPGEFTIKQLAELCVEKTGSKSKIVYLPLPGDDPKQRKPDITKARKYLQWEPKVPLEKGLDFAITYFRELDLGRFKKPTKHTAHLNTDALEGDKKRQKSA